MKRNLFNLLQPIHHNIILHIIRIILHVNDKTIVFIFHDRFTLPFEVNFSSLSLGLPISNETSVFFFLIGAVV